MEMKIDMQCIVMRMRERERERQNGSQREKERYMRVGLEVWSANKMHYRSSLILKYEMFFERQKANELVRTERCCTHSLN